MANIFFILAAAVIMTGCGLEKMANKYKTVSFTTTPATLQTHAGKVVLSLDATLPEKYFAKKVTIDFHLF